MMKMNLVIDIIKETLFFYYTGWERTLSPQGFPQAISDGGSNFDFLTPNLFPAMGSQLNTLNYFALKDPSPKWCR